MTITGELLEMRSQLPFDGFVEVYRDGNKELSLETVNARFIIADLIPTDVLRIGRKGFTSQDWKAGDLVENAVNQFFLSHKMSAWPLLAVAGAAAYGIYKDKKKVGEVKPGQILLIGGGILGFSFLKQFLEKLGIWDSRDTKELDQDSTNPQSAWSPYYWHNIKPENAAWTYAITTTTATQYAKEIYNAFGAINDCEECAIAVFKRLRTKANLSFLAEVFSNIYGQDLLTFLRGGNWPQDRLSDADVNTISQYIKNLPDY